MNTSSYHFGIQVGEDIPMYFNEVNVLPKMWKHTTRNILKEDLNLEEFKQGLITSLWDTDMCEYSLDSKDVIITQQNEKIKITLIMKNE